MELSYQEKSIWVTLGATLLVYGRYFAMGGRGSLSLTIVLLVVIQIIGQAALAVFYGREPKDERDRIIESQAYRNGYVLLVIGVIACMNAVTPFNSLLMALAAAEIGKSITQLFLYRRGV